MMMSCCVAYRESKYDEPSESSVVSSTIQTIFEAVVESFSKCCDGQLFSGTDEL